MYIGAIFEYMYGPLKQANKDVRTESSSIAAAFVKPTISTTSTQAQHAVIDSHSAPPYSLLSPVLAVPAQTAFPTQAVDVAATCMTVETIPSYTPTAFKMTMQNATYNFGSTTANKLV